MPPNIITSSANFRAAVDSLVRQVNTAGRHQDWQIVPEDQGKSPWSYKLRREFDGLTLIVTRIDDRKTGRLRVYADYGPNAADGSTPSPKWAGASERLPECTVNPATPNLGNYVRTRVVLPAGTQWAVIKQILRKKQEERDRHEAEVRRLQVQADRELKPSSQGGWILHGSRRVEQAGAMVRIGWWKLEANPQQPYALTVTVSDVEDASRLLDQVIAIIEKPSPPPPAEAASEGAALVLAHPPEVLRARPSAADEPPPPEDGEEAEEAEEESDDERAADEAA